LKNLAKLLTSILFILPVLFFFQGKVDASGEESLVEFAEKFKGVPYQWGGNTPRGFDCSGFVTYVFKEFGVDLPRSSADQFYQGEKVTDLVQGDLVFFTTYKKGPSHAGIYIGDNKFIHASDNGVEISSLNESYYKARYLGAKRYIQPEQVKDAYTVKNGQIGEVIIKKKINLWKRTEDNKLEMVRVLNPGERYRVYEIDSQYGGQFNLGSKLYITNMTENVEYIAVQ
jgi:hypothetical protein